MLHQYARTPLRVGVTNTLEYLAPVAVITAFVLVLLFVAVRDEFLDFLRGQLADRLHLRS